MVFVIEEAPHSIFRREGDILVANYHIPLGDALTSSGQMRNKKIPWSLPNTVIMPGMEHKVPGQGWPNRKDGAVRGRGDLVIRCVSCGMLDPVLLLISICQIYYRLP